MRGVAREQREDCAWCGTPLTGKQLRFCGKRCLRRWWVREGQKRDRDREREADRYRRLSQGEFGRECKHCQASDSEVFFGKSRTECITCARARQRAGSCEDCGRLIRFAGEMCFYCRPPLHKLRVLLVEAEGKGRERSVWRSVDNGKVKILGRWRTIKSLPMTVALSSEDYIKTRC